MDNFIFLLPAPQAKEGSDCLDFLPSPGGKLPVIKGFGAGSFGPEGPVATKNLQSIELGIKADGEQVNGSGDGGFVLDRSSDGAEVIIHHWKS